MTFDSRLCKLEAKQKQVLRCPWCQFGLVDPSAEKKSYYQQNPGDCIETRCRYCGTKHRVSLKGLDERERELTILTTNSHRREHFQDERIFAAELWLYLRPKTQKQVQRINENENRQARIKSRQRSNRNSVTIPGDRRVLAQIQLRERAISFLKLRSSREAKAYGPATFALIDTIEEIDQTWPAIRPHPASSAERKAEYEWQSQMGVAKKREAAEIVLWGTALSETLVEIEQLELEQINREEEKRSQEQERQRLKAIQDEEARRRNLESLNRNRASIGIQHLPDWYGKT